MVYWSVSMTSQTAEFKTPLMSSAARRLPIGAEAQPEAECISACGRRRPRRSRWCRSRTDAFARRRARARGGRLLLGVRRRTLRAGTRYRYRLDGELLSGSRRRAFSRTARSAPSQVVDPRTYVVDVRALRRACRCADRCIYEMHVGTFTREGTWRSAASRAAAAGANRHHRGRGHAGGRVPGAVRMGIRRRVSVRADAALWHAGRLPRVRRRRASARPRRDPRRRLQPSRAGRLRVRQILAATISRARPTNGATG